MNIISLLKLIVLLEWAVLGITVAVMKLHLLMLKLGYMRFYMLYSTKSLEEVKEGCFNLINKMFKLKKELLINSSMLIIALLSLFIITIFLYTKIEFSPRIFLWMIGGVAIMPLFLVMFEFYLKQTILEIDKIKAKNIDKEENK